MMLIPVTCQHDQHLQILELNNLSVDLMETDSFQLAAAALREAIVIFKGVVGSENSNMCTQQSSSKCKTIMLECTKELLKSKPLCPLALGAMYSLGAPFRMQTAPRRNDPDSLKNNETMVAVLLFNFGLLNRWASFKNNDESSRSYKESASKLLSMSRSVLMRANTEQWSEADDICEMRLCLILQVLNTMYQIEKELGNHADANLHRHELESFGRVAFFKLTFGRTIQQPSAPAA